MVLDSKYKPLLSLILVNFDLIAASYLSSIFTYNKNPIDLLLSLSKAVLLINIVGTPTSLSGASTNRCVLSLNSFASKVIDSLFLFLRVILKR